MTLCTCVCACCWSSSFWVNYTYCFGHSLANTNHSCGAFAKLDVMRRNIPYSVLIFFVFKITEMEKGNKLIHQPIRPQLSNSYTTFIGPQILTLFWHFNKVFWVPTSPNSSFFWDLRYTFEGTLYFSFFCWLT